MRFLAYLTFAVFKAMFSLVAEIVELAVGYARPWWW